VASQNPHNSGSEKAFDPVMFYLSGWRKLRHMEMKLYMPANRAPSDRPKPFRVAHPSISIERKS
jgi:hypothetical protein